MTPATLILAAGGSTRMGPGRDKLAEQVGGLPLLGQSCTKALTLGMPVYACIPSLDHARLAFLPDAVIPVPVPDAALGMGHSIAAGVRALPATITDVMILPADMPDLTSADLAVVWAAHRSGGVTRGASADGKPGHPVIFPADRFEALSQLTGDQGARAVVKGFSGDTQLVPLPGQHALTDLDTPEAWTAWRAKQAVRD